MPLSPRTPVLVGVGTVLQREEDPARAQEPFELMARAVEAAAEDAGSRALLERADRIAVTRGFWEYADPGRLVAERIGATKARTTLAEIGILQTTLFARAALEIERGGADVVVVTGGEAKYRSLRAQIAGVEAPIAVQGDVQPDERLEPKADILHPLEISLGLPLPVRQFALMENALRAADGQGLDAHRDEVAALWAGFAEVARDDPRAWNPSGPDAGTIRNAGPRNPMLAFPYTKLHNSQWNVDQAAGLIFCSLERARALGLPEDRFVFPHVVTESNAMRPLSERRALHRSVGFEVAGKRACEHAALGASDFGPVELYSCFPIAVRLQVRAFGFEPDRPFTVCGGMPFAGGPLNNFVFQAAARLAEELRASRERPGLLTAVSGILVKQGVSIWSPEPPEKGFYFEDVADLTEAALEVAEVVPKASGSARVAATTVLFEGDEPAQGVFVCDFDDGTRTLALCQDRDVAAAMTREEFCGRRVRVDGQNRAAPV